MNIVFRGILLSILLSAGLQSTASGQVVVDRIVAVVNGEVITLSDLQREQSLKKIEGAQGQRLLLEDMIDRKLQMAAAKRAGMDVTDKELNEAMDDIMKRNSMDAGQFEAALVKEGLTLKQYKSELREQMTLSRMFNKSVQSGISVDEAEVRSFYDRNAKNYSLGEEIRVREIFFKVPENASPERKARAGKNAREAYDRAKRGEDFIRLVKELSESELAALGGDMGFLRRDQAVSEIQKAVKDLKPGEIAEPVLFGGGFHVIRLEEVRNRVQPFEKVKDEITKMLYEQKLENTYRTWLQTLRSEATIENRL